MEKASHSLGAHDVISVEGRLPSLLGMPPRLDPFKKQPRKFVLLADMLPRGLAFVLICSEAAGRCPLS